ncbi:MAG TPA: UDP-3-O-(3-hydroxymyristoyl)glucosamine N-acyltransferase [Terriglobales bacterium]|nr:UDP-3-O-(3-hydroxymyristoyl)glucosamine N-acyltransferase [Terriglobales bacterium]
MIRLSELAQQLECECEGDGEVAITGIASLGSAGAGDLAFLTDPRRQAEAAHTRAAALLVGRRFPRVEREPALALLRAERPEVAVARAVELLRPAWRPGPGIDPSARIHPSAEIGPGSYVGAFVAIGEGCRIGADAVLHPHVVIYPDVVAGERFTAHAHAVIREGTRIGNDVILQPGVVIGGDGFGFARRADGGYAKIPQVGRVRLEDRVEIQANSCVDRASLEETRLGAGVKLDNLVQVAHNCDIEADTILCAQVGLAGSTQVGEGAVLAGQAGVAGHCRVGRGTVITAQSGTHGDLEAGKMYSGSPAFEHGQWLRSTAAFARLGDMQRELRELRARVRELSGESGRKRD